MRERLGSLIGPVAQRMWVSTFHSACVRILRRDGKSIGLKSGFSIYDSADSERLVKNGYRQDRIQPRHQALHSTLDSRPYLRPSRTI